MPEQENDPFSEKKESTQKDKFVNVLAYVPFLNIFLLYTSDKEKLAESRYIAQWIALFAIYIVLFIVLMMISGKMAIILFLAYLMFASYCAIKAYNGDYVEFEPLENIIAHFNKNAKNAPKKQEKSSEDDPLGSFKK